MGGKSDAPAPPDYRGAAQETAAGNKELIEAQTRANRPNQNTPWGSSSWQQDAGGNWTQDINLSDQQQRALDDQMGLQAGRSAIAGGMLGNANREMQTPDDFWNTLPDVGGAPDVPDWYGQGLPQMGQFPNPNQGPQQPEGAPQYGDLADWGQGPQAPSAGDLPGRGMIANPALGALGPTGEAANQGQYNPEDIQRGLDYSGLDQVQAGGGYQDQFAQTQFDRNMSLQGPQMERQRAALENRLRNQGLDPGSEAYDNAMGDLRNQQGEMTSRMSQDSVMAGAQEQQRQFERELAGRQQGVTEVGTQGMFGNQASQQAMDQQLRMGGQQFSEGMTQAQFAEQQRAARAGEQGQQFGQNVQAGSIADQQRAQASQEAGQQFTQGQQESAMQNQLRGQQFDEMRQMQDMYGGSQDQQFQRELQAAQFANQQRQQLGNEQLAFGGQGFNQQMQQSNMQNQLRQQAVAEQMQREGWSLNKINAMMSGQQVGMPSMPSFNPSGVSQGADYLGAAGQQGNYQMAAHESNIASAQAPWQALGSIGGGMASAGMFGAGFSDERLKTNIKKVGKIGPLDTVTWDWNDAAKMVGSGFGFIAQQVREFFPEFTGERDGYLTVDYDGVLGAI